MTVSEREKLVFKTVMWLQNTANAVTKAGGNPYSVINRIPVDILYTLVANDLYIQYLGVRTKDDVYDPDGVGEYRG